MSKKSLTDIRVATAMATPRTNSGNIAAQVSRRLAEFCVDLKGADALVVAGTTGEAPTLTDRQQYHLFREVKTAVGDRCRLIAGTGSNETKKSVEMTARAAELEYDAVLSVVPYYNKPPQEGLVVHFHETADVGLPVILYNIPGRTGLNMEPETVAALSNHKNIVGIKECNIVQIPRYRDLVPDDFLIYTGEDDKLIEALDLRARGVISVASHMIGKEMARVIEIYQENPKAAAKCMQKYDGLIDALFMTSNPIMIKAGLEMLGFNMGYIGKPLIPANPAQHSALRREMNKLGLL